ncbi:hypothetical protein [Marinagarivorans algicola]|uniref:hypothetical protein n=1 Tax=Marinagarivorans algicola TaxID=1513270 RepID=UPI0006B5D29A|nr:hypothetical protein [Marinagarivorans algicola]
MTNNQFAVDITVPQAQLNEWVELINGLCEGQLGAYLEERLEAFNPKALELMDKVLDDWLAYSHPQFFDFEQQGNRLRCQAEGPTGFHRDLAVFKKVLELCGATVNVQDNTLLDYL